MTTLAEALAPKSDQLNADDLIAGPRVLKITQARIAKDGRETKIVLNYEGDNGKPWKPCKTMGRAMVMAWKIQDPSEFAGKSVRVYRDPSVRFGDQGEVGGIRISHMSHLQSAAKVKLTVSQGKKGEFTFSPLVTEAPAPIEHYTIEAAELDLRAAKTLDDLGRAWKRRIMEPYRAQLQAVLDERKAALAPASDDRADLIASFERVTTAAELANATKAMHGLGLGEDPDVLMARDAASERVA